MIFAWIRLIIGVMLVMTVYFAPWGIALLRKHNNVMPVFLVNFLLGWTIIGWIIALIWATTSNVSKDRPLGKI